MRKMDSCTDGGNSFLRFPCLPMKSLTEKLPFPALSGAGAFLRAEAEKELSVGVCLTSRHH